MAAGNGSSLADIRSLRKDLREARGKRKLDLLLSGPDPAKLVRALPPEELYLALLDIGPDDAPEIVAMATPEQFRHFVDMSAWHGGDEGPRNSEVLRWVRLSREGSGEQKRLRFRGQLSGLDVELLALVLRRGMTVYDLGEDEDPRPKRPELSYYTPDRRFLLEFSSEDEFSAMRQVIEALYERDEGAAGRLIEATRWEQPAELEEAARRWRDGRLRDLGVPDFEEAISFYARPAATKGGHDSRLRAHHVPGSAPGLAVPRQGSLVDAALELLEGDDLERAEEAVVYAANAALVANKVPLDDPDQVREQLAEARATLSLGLELLSSGDPERASRLLVEMPIRQIFQAAMGEAYRLQTRARRNLAGGAAAAGAERDAARRAARERGPGAAQGAAAVPRAGKAQPAGVRVAGRERAGGGAARRGGRHRRPALGAGNSARGARPEGRGGRARAGRREGQRRRARAGRGVAARL